MLALGTAFAAAVALAIAIGSETFAQLVPCALCLVERWPYRIVIGLGLLAAVTPRGVSRGLLNAAALCLLGGALLGAVHVGVEFGWWPSPLPECAAPHVTAGSIAERLAAMPARPAKPCDEPTYLVPGLPLSMAAMNLVYALAFAATVAISLENSKYRRR